MSKVGALQWRGKAEDAGCSKVSRNLAAPRSRQKGLQAAQTPDSHQPQFFAVEFGAAEDEEEWTSELSGAARNVVSAKSGCVWLSVWRMRVSLEDTFLGMRRSRDKCCCAAMQPSLPWTIAESSF